MLLLKLKNTICWILILERRDTSWEHYRHLYHVFWSLEPMHKNIHGILVYLLWYLSIFSVHFLIAIAILEFKFTIWWALYWRQMIDLGVAIHVRSQILILMVLLNMVLLLTYFYILFLKLRLVLILLMHNLKIYVLIISKISLYRCKIDWQLFFLKFPAFVRSIFQSKNILMIIASIHRSEVLSLICILYWIFKLFQCIWIILYFIWLEKFHKSIIGHIFFHSNSFSLFFYCVIIQKILFVKSFLLNWSSLNFWIQIFHIRKPHIPRSFGSIYFKLINIYWLRIYHILNILSFFRFIITVSIPSINILEWLVSFIFRINFSNNIFWFYSF